MKFQLCCLTRKAKLNIWTNLFDIFDSNISPIILKCLHISIECSNFITFFCCCFKTWLKFGWNVNSSESRYYMRRPHSTSECICTSYFHSIHNNNVYIKSIGIAGKLGQMKTFELLSIFQEFRCGSFVVRLQSNVLVSGTNAVNAWCFIMSGHVIYLNMQGLCNVAFTRSTSS